MHIVNLLEETERMLDLNGKTKDDICWIGSEHFTISIDDFIKLADFDYDNDYGSQKVAMDLVIVGKDWWMTRAEYDGSEWWDFHTAPHMPSKHHSNPISIACGQNNIFGGWRDLIELNLDILD